MSSETIIIPATTEHSATVIFVHGLGDSGRGVRSLIDRIRKDPGLTHIKWILPSAPVRWVDLLDKGVPSWYNIFSPDFSKPPQDEEGMQGSVKIFTELIKNEINSSDSPIPPSRIVLGGFSQGGTMSLLTGLTCEFKLAGLLVLSGRLPLPYKFKEIASSHASNVPIFYGHGSKDLVIPLSNAQSSVKVLTDELGFSLQGTVGEHPSGLLFKVYEGMPHTTIHPEVLDVVAWLRNVVPEQLST